MLNKYNKFIDKDIITESYDIKEIEKSISNITNRAKDALKVIKYKYYNVYTYDKAEIEVNKTYYAVMRFEPPTNIEETKELNLSVFLAQIKLKDAVVSKIKAEKQEVDVNIYNYIISGFGSNVAEKTDILNKYKQYIKLIKTAGVDYVGKVNQVIGDNQVYGFYLFSKESDIEDILYNKLKVNKNKFQGEILSADTTEQSKVIGGVSPSKKELSLYLEKTNKMNVIIYLKPSGKFNYLYLDLNTAKTDEMKNDEFPKKYIQYKDSNNQPIQLSTYFKTKLDEVGKEADLEKRLLALNKYSNYIVILDKYTSDKNAKDILSFIVESIISKYKLIIKTISENKDASKKDLYNKLLTDINKYSDDYTKLFRATNTEIANLYNEIKSETDKILAKKNKNLK